MIELSTLKNTHRPKRKKQRVGRGVGSKRGKTSCRGAKGGKSRAGYRRRLGKEGGQLPLFKKIPCRGFSRGRFKVEKFTINLDKIDSLFEDGDTVNIETLREKGLLPKRAVGAGLKILAKGDLTKKIFVEAHDFSKQARKKLENSGIEYKIIS